MNDEAFAGQCGANGLGCLAGGKLHFFPADGGGPDAEPFGIGAQVIGIVEVVEFLELVDLLSGKRLFLSYHTGARAAVG